MTKILMLLLILIPVILVPVSGQAAPVYKWTDDRGVIHYSAKPHHEIENIETIETPDYSERTNISTDSENEAMDTDQPEEVENNTPSPEQLARCKVLKSNLNTLKSSPRVRIKRENGEFEILSDNARKAEASRIEKEINESC